MGIEVEFISKEFIKPSSPTPHHLRKLNFSFIDQNQFPISMPFLLFYEKSDISSQLRCNLLKQSLSKALTISYPLAGRINNTSYADCNDDGALFIQATADCNLSDILRDKNQYHNHCYKFIPLQPDNGIHQYGSLFQITFFNCGGLAVSFAMPHMLGDALSTFIFLNSWAAIARGNSNTVDNLSFGTDSIFPPRKMSGFDLTQWVFKENVVTKSFVFDASTISFLRDTYSSNNGKLSRVLALEVSLLSRLMAANSQAKESGENKRYMVINSVNVRQSVDPPVSNRSFGNLIWVAPALIDEGEECYEMGRKIKEAIASVNADSVRKLQNGELNFREESFKGETIRYSFSSLLHFGMYGVDFGWGKPEWVATNGFFFDNFIGMVDTKDGEGIEVWICLTEEDMAKLEKDKQLLSLLSASSSPSRNQNVHSRL